MMVMTTMMMVMVMIVMVAIIINKRGVLEDTDSVLGDQSEKSLEL